MSKAATTLSPLKTLTSALRLKFAPDDIDRFLSLIVKRRFDVALEWLLQDSEEVSRLVIKYMTAIPPRKEPLLHLILQSQPPVEIVALLLSAMSDHLGADFTVEESVNSSLQTPLHMACLHHCSPEVVHELLQGRSGAVPAVCRDMDDRYPLHLLFVSELRGTLTTNMEIVKLLLKCESHIAHIADAYHRTPLDYARAKRVDDRIVDLLLEANILFADNDDLPAAMVDDDGGDDGDGGELPPPLPAEIDCDADTADDISALELPVMKSTSAVDLGWADDSEPFQEGYRDEAL